MHIAADNCGTQKPSGQGVLGQTPCFLTTSRPHRVVLASQLGLWFGYLTDQRIRAVPAKASKPLENDVRDRGQRLQRRPRNRRSMRWTAPRHCYRSGSTPPKDAPTTTSRHGTTTLFVALEVATGRITADACFDRDRNDEFLAFLKTVARAHPRGRVAIRGRRAVMGQTRYPTDCYIRRYPHWSEQSTRGGGQRAHTTDPVRLRRRPSHCTMS